MAEEKCGHPRFRHELKLSYVDVGGMGGDGKPLRQLFAKLKLTCAQCQQPFVFRGHWGVSTFMASISPDGTELRAPVDIPIEPSSDDEADEILPTIH